MKGLGAAVAMLLLLLAVAAPSASAAPRCGQPPGWTVEGRSAEAVVYASPRRSTSSWIPRLTLCSRATGRLHELTGPWSHGEDSVGYRFLFAGPYVAVLERHNDRYMDDTRTAVVYDARTGVPVAPRRWLAYSYSSAPDPLPFVALAEGGQLVAHVRDGRPEEQGEALVVEAGAERIVVVPPSREPIESVSVEGDLLRWTAGGRPGERRLPPIAPTRVVDKCVAPEGFRIAQIGTDLYGMAFERVEERDGRRYVTYVGCVPYVGELRPIGTFVEDRGRRIERLYAKARAVGVFERVTVRGRSRLRVTVVDIDTGARHRGWTTRRTVPSPALELVDVNAIGYGAAWTLRVGPQLRVGVLTADGVRTLDRGPLSTRLGEATFSGAIGVEAVAWMRGNRTRSRDLG